MHKICRLRLLQQPQPLAEVGMCTNGDDIAHGKGFDFLGYHFGSDGLCVAKKTVENFVARAIRRYEQEPPGRARVRPDTTASKALSGSQ